MMKRVFWVGLCLASLLAASGCSKVKSCKEGEAGCIGGSCDNGACEFDLECVRPSNKSQALCGKLVAANSNTYDFGGDMGQMTATPVDKLDGGSMGDGGMGDAGGGSDAGPTCSCPSGQLCTSDGMCAEYCVQPSMLPGSVAPPTAIFCDAEQGQPALTFDEVCKRNCQLLCQRRSQFCNETCAPSFCDSQEVLDACNATMAMGGCGDATDKLACMTSQCTQTRGLGCSQDLCTTGKADCTNVRCENTCKNAPFDGACDDGDVYSSDYAECDWGTDCADCGPRRGETPKPQPQGSVCQFNTNCEGFSTDLKFNKSWCVGLPKVVKGLYRCVPDCSAEDRKCPDGYSCEELQRDPDGSGPMQPAPIVQGNLTGKGCFPKMCL